MEGPIVLVALVVVGLVGMGLGVALERNRVVRRLVQRKRRLDMLGYDCPTPEEIAANRRLLP